VNRASAGDPKATSTLLNEARFQESQNQQLSIAQTPVAGPEDQMVMDNILQRIRLSQPFYLDPESHSEEPSEDESSTSIEPNEGEV
jgi:hypothetical protein